MEVDKRFGTNIAQCKSYNWGIFLHLKGNGILKARLHSSFYVQYGKQFPGLEVKK